MWWPFGRARVTGQGSPVQPCTSPSVRGPRLRVAGAVDSSLLAFRDEGGKAGSDGDFASSGYSPVPRPARTAAIDFVCKLMRSLSHILTKDRGLPSYACACASKVPTESLPASRTVWLSMPAAISSCRARLARSCAPTGPEKRRMDRPRKP